MPVDGGVMFNWLSLATIPMELWQRAEDEKKLTRDLKDVRASAAFNLPIPGIYDAKSK
jgi:hypothetical protein